MVMHKYTVPAYANIASSDVLSVVRCMTGYCRLARTALHVRRAYISSFPLGTPPQPPLPLSRLAVFNTHLNHLHNHVFSQNDTELPESRIQGMVQANDVSLIPSFHCAPKGL